MQRSRRITRGVDFDRARESGKTYRNSRLVFLVRPNGLDVTRFGFVASKRLGSAVVRNRLRRLLREIARHTYPAMRSGFDVVVIVTRQAVGSSYHDIQESFEALSRRAGLLGDES